MKRDPQLEKRFMIEHQLKGRGIQDPEVLHAMETVPREAFVDPDLKEQAYEDRPLPTLEGQTVSQPYIVALMLESLKLKPTDRVLDVGTGSGYAASVLSRIVAEVYTIERHASLLALAQSRFLKLGYTNIDSVQGDGTQGWPKHAPYDAISIAAAGPAVPEPLLAQLKVGGRLVMPVGTDEEQQLILIERLGQDEYRSTILTQVRFVPLVPSQ